MILFSPYIIQYILNLEEGVVPNPNIIALWNSCALVIVLIIHTIFSLLNEKNLEKQIEVRVEKIQRLCEIYCQDLADMGLEISAGTYGAYIILRKRRLKCNYLYLIFS